VTRAPKFHFLMRDLALELDAERMTELEAAGRVAQHIQQTLKCVHVTFWSVSGELGRRVMRSVAAYDGTKGRVVAGAAAFPEAGGGFFGALVHEGCFVCEDTFEAPVLQGVKQTMLVPFNIRACWPPRTGARRGVGRHHLHQRCRSKVEGIRGLGAQEVRGRDLRPARPAPGAGQLAVDGEPAGVAGP
jgi:hypothetical protein